MNPIVGILAVHGNVAEHRAVLHALGQSSVDVRSPADLERCTHLIIPGGESTVMAQFLENTGLHDAIVHRTADSTLAILGTCAGAILLAKEVTGHRAPRSLNLLDITMERNAYGSQTDSFEDVIDAGPIGMLRCAFIRAPRITRVGKTVDVLATRNDEPIIVRNQRIVAATCHPEQRGETRMHQWFCSF
jgi:5'-phosphate synthase pdxT subunit